MVAVCFTHRFQPEYEFATKRVLDVAKAGEAIRAFLQK